MAGIRNRDTKPEMQVRRRLHRLGFRYRLHVPDLPGRPDLVLARYRAVIFVNGCFWHGHDCHLFKWPTTRRDFWAAKLAANRTRDHQTLATLRELGWRTAIVWECALRGADRDLDGVVLQLANWLTSDSTELELRG